MNYLEAEDDCHGPAPMEVGAMKGKRGDKGKKGHDKRKKATSTEKTTSTAKTMRKEIKQERKAKEKARKRRDISAKFEFPGLLHVMW